MLALPQDGYPVADLQHLVQLMGDDDDGLAVRLHAPQHVEQAGDFLGRQHRRGLVQNQNIRAAVQHFENFNRLLFGHGHIIDFLLRVQVEAVFFRQLRDRRVDGFQVIPALLLHAQHDIFARCKQIHQFEMLVNHADPVAERVLGGPDHHLLAVHENLPLVGEIDAGNHVHQGGLAAAVLPQDGQNLAPVHVQVYMVVGNHAAEPLRDPAHLQRKRFFHGQPLLVCLFFREEPLFRA